MLSSWNVSMETSFARGIEHFNRREFFAAHEELEDAWRADQSQARLFLQGLTQVAVALHHHSTGNPAGAKSVLARALRNLSGYPDQYKGVDLARLRQDLSAFHAGLLEGARPMAVPQIVKSAPTEGSGSAPGW
jgi:uncharacterized protein